MNLIQNTSAVRKQEFFFNHNYFYSLNLALGNPLKLLVALESKFKKYISFEFTEKYSKEKIFQNGHVIKMTELIKN